MNIKQSSKFIPTNRLEQYGAVNEKGKDPGQMKNFVINMAGRASCFRNRVLTIIGIIQLWARYYRVNVGPAELAAVIEENSTDK